MLLKPTFNLSPSMLKTLITHKKNPSFLLNWSPWRSRSLKPLNPITRRPSQHLSTAAAAVPHDRSAPVRKGRPHNSTERDESQMGLKAERRARRNSPSGTLLSKLCSCSRDNDTKEALRLYEEALINDVPLNVEHYNKLLYLCSSSTTDLDLERGFEIYKRMESKVVPNEATFTTMARLAAAKEDPEMAFNLVKRMKEECGISPKLRSYVPALSGFCKKEMADKAYEVDAYMIQNGVAAEEVELAMLLGVSSHSGRVDKVYEMLHRLRAMVRQVSEDTATLIEDWFSSDRATGVGQVNWDVEKVREAILERGGGWHGQGWFGNGKWQVMRTKMDARGVCQSCGEKLVSIDLDPLETENFASSLSNLACQRETRADFLRFQEWLQKHGPFDAVVDGANVGYLKNYFDFNQLKYAVNSARKLSPSNRLPLVILHSGRVRGQHTGNPRNKTALQQWNESGALYVTPQGSNDDWYWLYAAISSKCLLVTNDEMRDHLFELLGTNFFPRWKEKHQVRLSLTSNGLQFHMPPPYSIVIQESERGRWHIPTVCRDDLETNRQWVCAQPDHVTVLP
ncbi:proteinaceous RNase P 1, chloroplastic/mitochondrial [Cynara cardunculus var. scolymus]|uniref:ribonuclease P n=1 Tax=Cynara cardunculus var. scolymus TaxID=59895 RepID=A0A103YKS4_CYNCS|nr:proteinaceous RNase P 1, chloroplastic/mitochondrial [Cynara cardunculus var. scolymus]KVI10955.1 Pentatricopeptide repeat-containing protein [Cynara cardunculus var. scolymus]